MPGDELVELVIDGRRVSAPRGATILEAARALGIDVPALCHLPGLPPRNVCRLCVVAVAGAPQLVTACSRAAEPGMVVETAPPAVRAARRTIMQLVLAEHGACGRRGCEVEALAARLGVTGTPFQAARPDPVAVCSEHLAVDPALCVHCDRCIRACRDRHAIGRVGRGPTVSIGFDADLAAGESTCSGCGDCLAACPSGAIAERGA